MSCATAKRWFVPDIEYHRTAEDYALVQEQAETVRQELFAYDNETDHQWVKSNDECFAQWLRQLRYSSGAFGCYDFVVEGKLVYADVDENDPEHKKMVYGRMAKESYLDEEGEKTAAVRKMLKKSLKKAWRRRDEDASDDEVPDMIKKASCTTILNTELVDYLIQLKDKEATKVLLHVLSGQAKRKTPRPVMLLIGMVDKAQTDKRGLTEGWATGFDFVKELLIIKPFISKKGHHPLGEKWHDNVANDGVSFTGAPAVFAENFVKLGAEVGGKTEIDGLKLLVHTFVAQWILQQWEGFNSVKPEKWTDGFAKSVRDAEEKIDGTLTKRKPVINQKTAEQKSPIEAFEYLANQLAREDLHFRCSALDARKGGNGKAAQNAAIFYERLVKDLKSFNENPDNQF